MSVKLEDTLVVHAMQGRVFSTTAVNGTALVVQNAVATAQDSNRVRRRVHAHGIMRGKCDQALQAAKMACVSVCAETIECEHCRKRPSHE